MRYRSVVVAIAVVGVLCANCWPFVAEAGDKFALTNLERTALQSMLPPHSKITSAFSLDLNEDGTKDLVCIYNSSNFLVALGKEGNGYRTVLDYRGTPMGIEIVNIRQPDGAIRKAIKLSQSYAHADWQGDLLYIDGAMRVINEEGSTYGRLELDNAMDYMRGTARREFVLGSSEKDQKDYAYRFKPILSLKADGKIAIDGKLDEAAWMHSFEVAVNSKKYVSYRPERWHGPRDLSFSVKSLWDNRFLYLGIRVTDDHVVFRNVKGKSLFRDHVEVWEDNLPYGPIYLNDDNRMIVRNKPDENTLQLGIFANGQSDSRGKGSVEILYPAGRNVSNSWRQELAKAQASVRRTPTGYVVECKIPLALLGIKPPKAEKSFVRGDVRSALFTVAVSDTDSKEHPQQDKIMASSQLKWGNQTTFGELYLLRKNRFPLFDESEAKW